MEERVLSPGQGVLYLTTTAAVSQLLAFGYRVALSRLVGAEVMGLYQLVVPVCSVLLSMTAVGLTAALSNLTARHLALGDRGEAARTRGLCLRAFFLLLLPVGLVVLAASDAISVCFLGDARTQLALVLLVPCVALTGVENLHKHLLYGAGCVRTPAVVELLEQVVRIGAVLGLLYLLLPQYPERVVGIIVTGMVVCEMVSAAVLLVVYHVSWRPGLRGGRMEAPAVRRRRVATIALPVGLNALLGNWMSAANAALIPRKLVEGGMDRGEAIARFGVVSGMTLPMLALPTVFLGALNLVLTPRVARAHALGHRREVQRLMERGITVVGILSLPAMGAVAMLGGELGQMLFHQRVEEHLLPLAGVMAVSCYSSVLAAGLNAVGRQRAVAVISFLGGAIQLAITLWLVPLPGVGMDGYVAGAALSTGVETALFLLVLLRTTGLQGDGFRWLAAPAAAAGAGVLAGSLMLRALQGAGMPFLPAGALAVLTLAAVDLGALGVQGLSPRAILGMKKKTPTVKNRWR